MMLYSLSNGDDRPSASTFCKFSWFTLDHTPLTTSSAGIASDSAVVPNEQMISPFFVASFRMVSISVEISKSH